MAKEKDSSLLTYETHVRFTEEMKNLLSQRAKDEGISSNAVIQKAISLYLTKDTMDESLVIAKMTDVQRQIARLKHEIDVKQKLDLEWYQYFFLFAPPIPQEEVGLRMQKANRDVQAFLQNFKHRAASIKPLIETIFGDMLEEEAGDGN